MFLTQFLQISKCQRRLPPPYTIPDYKIYRVENIPTLVNLQSALAARGLKDPWIRNEVWRYDQQFGSHGTRFRAFFLRGFKTGIVAFLMTLWLENIMLKPNVKEHHN